jgi:hypothetical protein
MNDSFIGAFSFGCFMSRTSLDGAITVNKMTAGTKKNLKVDI